ncbi:hypothetical protein [Actinoplanes aureus]|uniref:Uncharacterized protein n=1 Tax=Actinoplanes aureus TaxID=2792083 RepID=A0A931CJ54_9ACTN|nr:hypothetical protein [Actinoplanes aureus]MBG0568071.1 hypothetical protein [Actinoplanes aureus]
MAQQGEISAERSVDIFLNALKKLSVGGAFLIVAGAVPLVIYGLANRSHFLQIVGVGSMVSAAAAVAGGFAGFLFGIPRSAQVDEVASSNLSRPALLRVNTNLEQISDWLTKILVGVSLVQLPHIADAGRRLTAVLADAIGGDPGSIGMAGSMLVYYLGNGFLGGYYLTRTTLTTVFAVSDVQIRDIDDRVRRAEERSEEALEKVERAVDGSR